MEMHRVHVSTLIDSVKLHKIHVRTGLPALAPTTLDPYDALMLL